jgi:hypothetical protein
MPTPRELPPDGETRAGPLTLTWADRHLTAVTRGEARLQVSSSAAFLEPVSYVADLRGWMTTALSGPARRMPFSTLRQTEFGPLRWCFERWGAMGPNHIMQRIHVYDDGRVACETRINHGVEACCFGLALPCDRGAALRASIPFGVEARDLDAVTYRPRETSSRMIERLIPGLFFARDWVSATDSGIARALVVLDGDRYWYRPPGEDVLVHLLLRSMPPVTDGWERYAAMDRAGSLSFRHVLCFGQRAGDAVALSRIADEARFPTRVDYAAAEPAPEPWEGIVLAPDHVRWLACRALGSEIEMRVVEAAGRPASVHLQIAADIAAARLTDLRGETLPDPVTVAGREIRFDTRAWQIRTVRLTLRRRLGSHMRL